MTCHTTRPFFSYVSDTTAANPPKVEGAEAKPVLTPTTPTPTTAPLPLKTSVRYTEGACQPARSDVHRLDFLYAVRSARGAEVL